MNYIQQLLEKLCRLYGAYERLQKANPNPVIAEYRAEQIFGQIMLLMEQSEVVEQIDQFLALLDSTPQRRNEAMEYLSQNLAAFIRTEIELMRPVTLKSRDIRLVVERFLRVRDAGHYIANTAELREQLRLVHTQYLRKIAESRGQPRKIKKVIKIRSIAGVMKSVTGVAMVTSNGAVVHTGPLVWTSGLIGLSMFIEGLEKLRD